MKRIYILVQPFISCFPCRLQAMSVVQPLPAALDSPPKTNLMSEEPAPLALRNARWVREIVGARASRHVHSSSSYAVYCENLMSICSFQLANDCSMANYHLNLYLSYNAFVCYPWAGLSTCCCRLAGLGACVRRVCLRMRVTPPPSCPWESR